MPGVAALLWHDRRPTAGACSTISVQTPHSAAAHDMDAARRRRRDVKSRTRYLAKVSGAAVLTAQTVCAAA